MTGLVLLNGIAAVYLSRHAVFEDGPYEASVDIVLANKQSVEPVTHERVVLDSQVPGGSLSQPEADDQCKRAIIAWVDSDDAISWRQQNGELRARSVHPYSGYSETDIMALIAEQDPEASLEAGRRALVAFAQSGNSRDRFSAQVAFERAAVTGLPLAYMNTAQLIDLDISTKESRGLIGPEEAAFMRSEARTYRRLAAGVIEGLPLSAFDGANDLGALSDSKTKSLMEGRYAYFRDSLSPQRSIAVALPSSVLQDSSCMRP